MAERLEAAGVDVIVLSGGFTSRAPFYLFRRTGRCISCNECVAEMDRNGVRCVLD